MKTHTLALITLGASFAFTAVASAQDAAKPLKRPKHHLTFAQADVDGNGGLSVFEYATTRGPGTPLVEIRRRFLPIDVSGAFEVVIDPITGLPAVDLVTGDPVLGDPIPDGLVSLEELQDYQALENKPKSNLGRFELADFDGDGLLDPLELGYLVSPKVKAANILRKFERLDTDNDGSVSPSEFKKDKSGEL